jgi:hypothetical protein
VFDVYLDLSTSLQGEVEVSVEEWLIAAITIRARATPVLEWIAVIPFAAILTSNPRSRSNEMRVQVDIAVAEVVA